MDDMDEQAIKDLQSNIESLNNTLGENGVLAKLLANIEQQNSSQNSSDASLKTAMEENTESLKKNTKQSNEQNKQDKEKKSQEKKAEETTRLFESSLKTGIKALADFSGALLSGADGFEKYGAGIKGFGESAKQAGEGVGGFGKAIGVTVDILAQLTAVMLQQADAQNLFKKEMLKVGSVAGNTTQELYLLANEAGVSSNQLKELTPILAKTSKALASFGMGTSDGLAKLLKVFALTDEQERTMRRFGYTLREAQEEQAYYIELQRMGGVNMQMQGLSQKTLRKDSMDYAKQIRVLSELTGVQADEMKSEQAIVAADSRNQIRNITDQTELRRIQQQLDGELTDAKRKELEERQQDIKAMIGVRQGLAVDLPAIMGKEMATKLMNVIGTGAFTEDTKSTALQEFDAGDLQALFENSGMVLGSDEYMEAIANLGQTYTDSMEKRADQLKNTIQLGSNRQEVEESFGLTSETRGRFQALRNQYVEGKDGNPGELVSTRDIILKAFEEKNKKGDDAQLEFAATIQIEETNIRTAADKALNALNPFTGAVNESKIAIVAMGAAAVLAAVQLTILAGSGPGGLIGGFKKMFKGIPGMLGLMKAGPGWMPGKVPGGGAALAVAASVGSGISNARDSTQNANMEFFQKTKDLDTETDKLKIKELEIERDRQITKGRAEGTGTAVGGAAGAGVGMYIGATIGLMGGPVGVAIGGMIGSGLGAWLGSALGKKALGAALTPDEVAAGQMTNDQIEMLSETEKKKYKKDRESAKTKIANEEDRQELLLKQLKNEEFGKGEKAISTKDLYDKDFIGDSEVNFKMLGELKRSGDLTADMVEAILLDNDINEASKAILVEQLQILKGEEDKAKTKKPKETKEPSGRTMDRPMEELILIFEADIKAQENIKAEKEAAEKLKTDLLAAEQALPGPPGTGDGADAVAVEDLLAVANIPQNTSYAGMAAEGGIFGSGEWGIVGEEGPEIATGPTEITPMDQIRKLMNLVDDMAGGSSQNDDIQGSISMTKDVQKHMLVTMNKALALAGMDPSQYEGKDMRKSPDFAALEELTKPAKLDTSGAWDFDLDSMSSPAVDISPAEEPEIADQSVDKASGYAQTKTDSKEMSEYEKLSLAAVLEQNKILQTVKTASVNSADAQEKIAKYASV